MSILDHIEHLVRGLQAFPGNKSIRLDVKLDDLSALSSELEEEYGNNVKIEPYAAMYVLTLHKEYSFYFSILED